MDKLDNHEKQMLRALVAERAVSYFDHAQRHALDDKEGFDRWIREATFWQSIADKIKPEEAQT